MPKKAKRADNRFSVQIYLGKGEDGKRKYKTVYGKTQREANEKAEELKTQLGKGLDIASKVRSYREWSVLYLKSQKAKLSESEFNTKEKRIGYFLNSFGDCPIESIRPFQIEDALTELAAENPATGKPTAGRTLSSYKQVCGQVFKFAIKNRIIEYNPADYAELPKNAPKKERRALEDYERERIIASSHRAKRAAMLAMFCGLRRGEMTALTWNDIDFKNNTVTINKSYNFKAKTLKLPKTDAGIRTVPMPEILSDFLQSEKRTSVYVICNAQNKMMSDNSWKRLLESFLCDLEIEYGISNKKNKFSPTPTVLTIKSFGWHDLRHTYATLLFEAGVDVLTAQYLLGHASAQTTMEIYTHLSNAQKDRSIVKLNDFLAKKSACKSDASQPNCRTS